MREEAWLAQRLAAADEPMFLARTSPDAPGRLRILEVNAAFARLTGFSNAQVQGRRVRSLYSSWTRTESRSRLHRSIQLRSPVRTSLVVTRANGSRLPVEWNLTPVGEDEDGSVLWTCLVRDASEQSLREELTRVSTRAWDFPAALISIQEAICANGGWVFAEAWVASRNGRVIKPGPAGPFGDERLRRFRDSSRQRGFRLGEGVPGRVFERAAPEWIEDLAVDETQPFERRDAALTAGLRSLVAVPLAGQRRTLAALLFYGERPRRLDRAHLERLVQAVSHLGPILERKRIEVQLRHRARQQEALARVGARALAERPELDVLLQQVARSTAETLQVEFCEVLELLPDRNGLLLRAGTGWPDGTVGRAVRGVGKESHAGCTLDSNEPVIVEDLRRETRFEPDPHLVRHGVRGGVSVLIHGTVGPWGVLGVHTAVRRRFDHNDIHFLQGVANVLGAATERHAVQSELDQHRRHLERMVIERTRRLEESHERIRQTERLASIGTLAAGLGHDISNLLLPTLCRLDALDAAKLPENVREELRGARSSLDYLRELSQGLRLLALDPDDPRATSDVTDIYAWWREVRPVFSKVLRRGCELRASFPPDLPAAGIPKHHLTQAVLNLVLNSADALEEGGRVLVSARAIGRDIAVTVADNGRGMPAEVRRRALDPFYSTKKRALSTGLGLSLVRALAKRAGGSVSMTSTAGTGTRVQLWIPRAVSRPREEDRPAALVRSNVAHTSALVSRLLESSGFRVTKHDDETCTLGVLDSRLATTEEAERLLAAGRRVVWLGPWPGAEVPAGLVAVARPGVGEFRRVLEQVSRQEEESRA